MFTASVRLLALLWPFFKESWLKDGTVKDWLRRNRNATIMIIFQIGMLLICFYLVEMISILRTNNFKATRELEKLQVEHAVTVEENKQWENDLKEERQTGNRMRVFLMQRCTQFPEPCAFLIEEATRREDFRPETKAENTASVAWCRLVQETDFADTVIRQRWLRECDTNDQAPPAGVPEVTP